MVSTSTTITIWCDRDDCFRWEYGSQENDTRSMSWPYWKRLGWRRVRRDGLMVDLCPTCSGAEPLPHPLPPGTRAISLDEISQSNDPHFRGSAR
jgi:hypothetical protein